VHWTAHEDACLISLVAAIGRKHWLHVAARMPHRSPRQCRDRWVNHLNPELTQTPWTDAEDRTLRAKHAELGPKWVKISGFLPDRSVNSIRNRALVLERLDQRMQIAAAPKANQANGEDDLIESIFLDRKQEAFGDEMGCIMSMS
jgi:hypothetical protein